jgi:hypothetical protein
LSVTDPNDYIGDAWRLCSPFWVFIPAVLLGETWNERKRSTPAPPLPAVAKVMLALMLSAAFWIPASYFKQIVLSRLRGEKAAWNGLRSEYLSIEGDPSLVLSAIERASLGATAVAVPAFANLGQETWLTIPGRLAPMTDFWFPAGNRPNGDGADYYSSRQLKSSKRLRVVLIVSHPFALAHPHRDFVLDLVRIERRFP